MNKLDIMGVPGLGLPLGRFEAAFFARLAIEVRAREMTRRRLAEWREAAEQHECFTSGGARAACADAVAAVDRLRASGLKRRAIKRRVLMLDQLVRRRDRYHRDSGIHVLARAESRLLRDFVRNSAAQVEPGELLAELRASRSASGLTDTFADHRATYEDMSEEELFSR